MQANRWTIRSIFIYIVLKQRIIDDSNIGGIFSQLSFGSANESEVKKIILLCVANTILDIRFLQM